MYLLIGSMLILFTLVSALRGASWVMTDITIWPGIWLFFSGWLCGVTVCALLSIDRTRKQMMLVVAGVLLLGLLALAFFGGRQLLESNPLLG